MAGKKVEYEDYSDPYAADTERLGEKRWDPYGNTPVPKQLKSYKADYKTGKLETLPMTWVPDYHNALPYGTTLTGSNSNPKYNSFQNMAGGLRALQASQQFGGPQVSPEDMAALINQEGRTDFGGAVDEQQYAHDKQAVALAKQLSDAGFSDQAVHLPASILAAQNTGKRLNTPWTRIWNGTGTNVVWGNRSRGDTYTSRAGETIPGARLRAPDAYIKESEMNKKVATDPKNADFLNFVRQNMSAPQDLDTLNQQEYQRRLAARQAYVDQEATRYAKSGMSGVDMDSKISHGLGSLANMQNPFASWTPDEIVEYQKRDVEKRIPAVRPYTPKKKNVKVASKASGGAITIDDGNPAKRRKLI